MKVFKWTPAPLLIVANEIQSKAEFLNNQRVKNRKEGKHFTLSFFFHTEITSANPFSFFFFKQSCSFYVLLYSTLRDVFKGSLHVFDICFHSVEKSHHSQHSAFLM